MKVLIVGAGFSGAVLARQLAELGGAECSVIDARPQLGGNCHTERNEETSVMIHRYGPHIFHTDNERVWRYVHRFGEFGPFVNRVKASIAKGVFSLPINLHTINQFFGLRLDPEAAKAFLAGKADTSIGEPRNFEEQALKFIGRELYEAFFLGYTRKQWGCDPKELPASILKRLPVRFDYNDSYYNSRFQGIPREGYTEIIRRILDHPLVRVELGQSFEAGMMGRYDHTFFTGPIDAFFRFSEGRLGYRTVYWEEKTAEGDFQGNAVINYPDLSVDFTRIVEHKHFAPWERHERTNVFTEFSKETGPDDIAYYPKRLAADKTVLARYRALAEQAERVSFLGRLATYRYMDMHHVIAEALDFADRWLAARRDRSPLPVFPNAEEPAT
jgi:UDP-galactopyranose mutase